MNKSRSFAILIILTVLAISMLPGNGSPASACFQLPAPAASEERDRGIKLYEQGDATGAIEALRDAVKKNKDDGDAWHYLGLALLLKGQKDEARKAFEKAATIRLSSMASTWPISNNSDPNARRLKAAEKYQLVIESFEKYLEVTPKPTADWIDELEALRFYHDYCSGLRNEETIMSTKEATTRLRILDKPLPDFSGTRASGTSVLRALFASDGTVKHVLVLRRVEPRFDQACIEAAKRVNFEPAIKDGHPVSMILQLEYRREIY
ncbi:MAG TPA: tetratricopeptide repeat protein [Pyrinomonadaceae bacterium]|nr:tetratricopeptide repeat protein [Pyrinomonadaceae bacterium]